MTEVAVPNRQPRAERTRARIVETAALAFAEHGYEAVSLNDLVRASGVSKGAFYFHFPSKEALALAAFRAKQEELVERVLADDASSTAAEGVVGLLRRRARLLREDPSLGCVTRLGSELNVRSGPGSTYASFQELALEAITGIIRAGQQSREFRAAVDAEAMATAIFAAIVGLDTLSLLMSGGSDLEVRSEGMADLILHGLVEPDADRGARPNG